MANLESDSIFSKTSSPLPDDTVFFSIFPDSSSSASLQSLHLQINDFLSPFTSPYIWQHDPFSLSISLSTLSPSCPCTDATPIPHLHGKLKYGDNLEDEWFAVFLLLRISASFPSTSLRVWDTDGEFLLIESAFLLPRWLNPETSRDRVFLRAGDLHIVPRNRLPNPSLLDSLRFLKSGASESSRASDPVQSALKNRVSGYPERAWRSMHRVRVKLPVTVAHVLSHEPSLISLAVERFYDRDVDLMKHVTRMEKFLSRREFVVVVVKMSRAMYGQLIQQKFQAPSCYPMPSVGDKEGFGEAEIGMKIACGMEMMYQERKKEGGEGGRGRGRGFGWSKYKESLEKSGYFEGLVCGSKEYKRLLENAEVYYQKSSSFSRTREVMSEPVRRIDEILAMPYSEDDFKGQEVGVSDDDSWLYDGEDELNSVLEERQKEMEFYNAKKERKQKGKEKEKEEGGSSGDGNVNNFDLGDISKSMEQFIQKVSSYKGAEVPENREFKEVNLDVDRFMKDIESMLGGQEQGDDDESDGSEGSSMDMDFEDDSEGEDPNDDDDEKEAFMESYSGAMNEELKNSTLDKSFEHVNQPSSKQNGESSKTSEDDDEFTPVDADFNLVKNLLESYSSQQGLPGPASNLLGLMGLQLPKDSNDK
ncbi:unnamed protein product [Eruca vesicaria subsp. sativa]|uniref:Protein ecdysoneless homolog n=1 Tax=Eruca vesicaria subsp. sativa TaxID=29727 RepID=A0ABC8L5U2_ERUVS|nr:unnamed protein product [Eruca vesicaria subsp. sativa]